MRSGPVTADEFNPSSDRTAGLRRVPALTVNALRMLWQASRSQVIAAFVLQALVAAATAGQLLMVRYALNQFLILSHGGSAAGLLPVILGLVATTAVVGTITELTVQQQHLLTELVGKHTFNRIIDVSTAVDLEAFDTPYFYDQLERARTSALVRSVQTVTAVSSLLTGLLTSVGIAGALVVLQPVLLPLVAVAGLPVLLATIRNSRAAYRFEFALTPQNRERMYLMQLLTSRPSAKEVRVFGAIASLRRRYDELTEERISLLRTFVRARLKVALVGNLAGTTGMALAMGSLAYLLTHHDLTVATAVTAALAMQQLSGRMTTVITSMGTLIESGMFIANYNAFLALAPEMERDGAPAVVGEETPRTAMAGGGIGRFDSVKLDRVSFTYPHTDAPVLRDISLEIGAGEVVALVGENGSGKTTLVKLMCQLYRPTTGRILWNGRDTAHLAPDQVRQDMTVIFQDYVQYHLSARDNILLGRIEQQPEMETVLAAARRSGADSFISRLPEGYETRLGTQFYGGHELSVGQWQRLALARAFYRDGSFLVLDEPTASLDPRAEHDLFSRMRGLANGRSVLLVSHRFSSVRSADRIYVLRDGRIAESGSHEELMNLGGHYAELFEFQAAAHLGGREAVA